MNTIKPNNQELKADLGKLQMHLIPPTALTAIASVLTFGANKYSPNSWQRVERTRYVSALMRHWVEYMKDPNSIDTESGMPHIWHVLTNAAFLTDMQIRGYDDRKKA